MISTLKKLKASRLLKKEWKEIMKQIFETVTNEVGLLGINETFCLIYSKSLPTSK